MRGVIRSRFYLFFLLLSVVLKATLATAPAKPVDRELKIKLVAPIESGLRKLTIEERVTRQRAIEEVYWRHRIRPDSNERAKIDFEQVVSSGLLTAKVEKYLHQSEALTAGMSLDASAERELLQAEMDRMAAQTRRPDVLRELYRALDDDPLLIAECLARPILIDRLSRTDAREFPSGLPASFGPGSSFTPSRASFEYRKPLQLTTAAACQSQTWTNTSTVSAPPANYGHSGVWTGSELIVWGGYDGKTFLNAGGVYDPATDSWHPTSLNGAPAGRRYHTGVWTGTEMIIWGGSGSSTPFLSSGATYDPVSDTWTAISQTNAPAARYAHTAVWTGSEMIVWGGNAGFQLTNTGGRYDPASNTWSAISPATILEGRRYHSAVWNGSEMIVWGGQGSTNGELNTGARYHRSTDSWTPLTTIGAPSARDSHTAIWTGSQMLIWGGSNATYPYYLGDGASYDPAQDNWHPLSSVNAPSSRSHHTAIWTGGQMLVWGGGAISGVLSTGGSYDPATGSWSATPTTGAPSGRAFHNAVWTGAEMIVWGGDASTGGRYCAGSVSQCVSSLSPASAAAGASGENGIVSVNAPSGCHWTAISNAAWLIISSGSEGTGSGAVGYSVAANTDPNSRTGTLTIGNQAFVITQAAGAGGSCTFSISPSTQTVSGSGGSFTANVSATGSGCTWSAVANVSWIGVDFGSGSGNGQVRYTVSSNRTGVSRKGKITVGGEILTIKQRAF